MRSVQPAVYAGDSIVRDFVLVILAGATAFASYYLHHELLGPHTSAGWHWAAGIALVAVVAIPTETRTWWEGLLVHAVIVGSVLGVIAAAWL